MKSTSFFTANQRGLIDPDSSVQDWTTTDEQKLRAYRKYLLWYNWEMNLAGINLSDEDKAAGKGFVNVPVEDLNIYQVADSYYGSGRVWGIGSGVDDATKEKIMQLFDWMASPEGISSCGMVLLVSTTPLKKEQDAMHRQMTL
jgi:multiple sugar transport system substrate-binding protein/putative aldouronate transport system substrate-binding protein